MDCEYNKIYIRYLIFILMIISNDGKFNRGKAFYQYYNSREDHANGMQHDANALKLCRSLTSKLVNIEKGTKKREWREKQSGRKLKARLSMTEKKQLEIAQVTWNSNVKEKESTRSRTTKESTPSDGEGKKE